MGGRGPDHSAGSPAPRYDDAVARCPRGRPSYNVHNIGVAAEDCRRLPPVGIGPGFVYDSDDDKIKIDFFDELYELILVTLTRQTWV